MATIAQKELERPRPLAWLKEFLKEELVPYPGRTALVARMVTAATIVMIITMTFRIPDGAYGAIYALNMPREDPQTTIKAVKIILIAFVCSAAYVLVGGIVFVSDPVVRFLWVIGTLFVMFFALRVVRNYTAAARFGYLIVITIPLWDSHIRASEKVEGTLWAVAAISIASVITACVELVFAALKPQDDLTQGLVTRLTCVERLLTSYADSGSADAKTSKEIVHLTMVGASRLRRILMQSSHSPQYLEQMGAVVGLVSRLVDLGANLTQQNFAVTDADRKELRALAGNIAAIRADLIAGKNVRPMEFGKGMDIEHTIPLLSEIKEAVLLIPDAFTRAEAFNTYGTPPPSDPPASLFVPDALSNVAHIRFALKGCLAASLCYIIYVGLDWPELNTAITTCFLTALTTIGASRQKQVLRFAGALVGGAVAMGSQIFILPALNSIVGFTVLVIIFTSAAAWIQTSSPRLSYFGAQAATGFYLINLLEFKIQTSLAVARDRVVGVLLGIFMMWLVFDQIWGAPAVVEMKKTFVANLRLLAKYMNEPLTQDARVALQQNYLLREAINNNFDKVRSLADGVLFEFGSTRQQDLELRSRFREWQPQLRLVFVTRIALVKYRLQLPGLELPEEVRRAQLEFDGQLAKMLNGMADRVEDRPSKEEGNSQHALEALEKSVSAASEKPGAAPTGKLQTFLVLSRRVNDLTVSLNDEI